MSPCVITAALKIINWPLDMGWSWHGTVKLPFFLFPYLLFAWCLLVFKKCKGSKLIITSRVITEMKLPGYYENSSLHCQLTDPQIFTWKLFPPLQILHETYEERIPPSKWKLFICILVKKKKKKAFALLVFLKIQISLIIFSGLNQCFHTEGDWWQTIAGNNQSL